MFEGTVQSGSMFFMVRLLAQTTIEDTPTSCIIILRSQIPPGSFPIFYHLTSNYHD